MVKAFAAIIFGVEPLGEDMETSVEEVLPGGLVCTPRVLDGTQDDAGVDVRQDGPCVLMPLLVRAAYQEDARLALPT
jgi:hypothetical protein